MNKKVFSVLFLVFILLTAALTGCGSKNTGSEKPLVVGVTAGPHAEIMEEVKKVAEKQGLKIKIVEFNDYIQPNAALNQGDIDANSFQHKPYMDSIIKSHGYDLTSVGKTIIAPMGIYSKKIKSLKDLPQNAVFGIPNDPTNGSRALILLEKQGIIKLKPNLGVQVAVTDIVDNPRNIKIKELDAALIPRSLSDLDAAAINTNYALTAGLMPTKDSLAIEDSSSPYANIIATQSKNAKDPRIEALVKAYQSDEVKQFINSKFQGSMIPAW